MCRERRELDAECAEQLQKELKEKRAQLREENDTAIQLCMEPYGVIDASFLLDPAATTKQAGFKDFRVCLASLRSQVCYNLF